MHIISPPGSERAFAVGGRLRPKPHAPRLHLANYLRASLPAPPPSLDGLNWQAKQAIRRMYLNDQLGDCVVAGAAHMIGVWTGEAKLQGYDKETLFSNDQLRAAYHNFSGGQFPATDSGCDEEFALNFWAAKGFNPGAWNPHKITCWVAVDATDRREVMTAIWLFGAAMSGVELPDAWINPPPQADGFVFDVAGAPNPEAGHCMTHFSYDGNGIGCSTWGMYGTVTWDALAKYMDTHANGALYAAVSEDALIQATKKAPNGFAVAELVADAHKIGFARP